MANKRKGKLELDWVDKGDIILTKFDENGKTYPASYFQGQVSDEELMPRELELIESVGDPNAENMLVWGENLTALRSLEREFAGKIKLIYIDPPFNTGQDFEDYEDGLEHSIWLSMMENRLRLAKKLLADGGAIFVHIDDKNSAYLRLLLDEIFGPINFRNSIITKRIKKSIKEREKVKTINTGHDFILYLRFQKRGLRLIVFTRGEKLEGVESFEYERGGAKWGRMHLRDEKQLEKAIPILKKSYELIKEAIKNNEPTGWYADLEEETEEDADEGHTTSDNTA